MWTPYARVYHPLKAGSIDGTDTEPHDHGIIRAMKAHYKPNKLVVGDPKCTLFVARLNPETSEESLRKFFSRYGDIVHCRLVLDIVSGFSKCYGFVQFKDKYSTAEAHRSCNKVVLDDHEIFVDYECERTLKGWVPRRLGGGFSGKKESGQLRFGGRDRPFRKPIVVAKPSSLVGNDYLADETTKEDKRENYWKPGHSDRHGYYKSAQSTERKRHREHYDPDRNLHRDKYSKEYHRSSKELDSEVERRGKESDNRSKYKD